MSVNRTNLGEVNFTADTEVEKSVVIKQNLDSTWKCFEVVVIKQVYYVVLLKELHCSWSVIMLGVSSFAVKNVDSILNIKINRVNKI